MTEEGGVTTSYTYNSSNDQLTKVTQNGSSVAYEYAKRKLLSITSPSNTKYTFTYNAFNQCISTTVGEYTLATNTYDSLGRLTKTVYGNGDTVENVYDSLSRVTGVKYDGTQKVSYVYDNDGNVSKVTDLFSNLTTTYRYDSVKRPVSMNVSNGYSMSILYDDKNRIESTVENIGSGDHVMKYYYNNTGRIMDFYSTFDSNKVVGYYDTDYLYRVTDTHVDINGEEIGWKSYVYATGETAGSTTSIVSYYNTNGNRFHYTYDDRNNITQITNNGVVEATYTYDEFDRLTSETVDGVTTTWNYDANGNILTKTKDGTTIKYIYGDGTWNDQLTSYNGQSIIYDEIGNPITWGYTSFTWDAGRRLMTMNRTGLSASFTYNADGYRTSKTVNGVTTTYYLDGDRISALRKGVDELVFIYDEKGTVIGFYHNFEPYVYVKNLQGDVIGIVDAGGSMVVTYKYDAWGAPLSIEGDLADTLGTLNPFRYRSYCYDDETGLYYLNSRYYDPVVGRFLNGDSVVSGVGGSVDGYNMYAYCFNNPVNMSDASGEWPKWAMGVLNTVCGTLQVATGLALGASLGWTGVGTIAAGFLVVNGAATITQGTGQIVNSISNSDTMLEDNIIKSGVESIGEAVGGDSGKQIAGTTYDIAVAAANIYAGGVAVKSALQQAGKIPIKVPISKVVDNPLDEFVTTGPAQGVVTQYCRTIPYDGYGKIYAIKLSNGLYQLTNGHHRVAALKRLGEEVIKIYLTK